MPPPTARPLEPGKSVARTLRRGGETRLVIGGQTLVIGNLGGYPATLSLTVLPERGTIGTNEQPSKPVRNRMVTQHEDDAAKRMRAACAKELRDLADRIESGDVRAFGYHSSTAPQLLGVGDASRSYNPGWEKLRIEYLPKGVDG